MPGISEIQKLIKNRCGSLLEILLYILRECLMANKNQMENFIIENHLSILNEAKSELNLIHSFKST